MEKIKNFFELINKNTLNIQNVAGAVFGLTLFVFALWIVVAFIYVIGRSSETWYHIPEQAIKVSKIILWICAVLLIVFGGVNVYKGHTYQGLIAIAFGLLWVLAVIFNFRLDFSIGDGAVNLCMGADKWNVVAQENLIKSWLSNIKA